MARRKQGKKKRAAAGLERRETGARAPASGEREAEQARSGKLFWWPLAIVLAVVVIVFFTRAEPGPLSFPPAVAGNANAEVVVYEDFAGSDACAGCHAEQFQMWESSTHGRAGGLPSSDVLITAFDGRAIRFKDAVVYPRTNSAGQYLFTVQQDNREPFDFVVAGVVGGGHMYGGGTQGFLSAYPDGTLRFLPFDFIRIEGVWFCNTNTRTNEGWIPITREMLLRDCGDWPPIRVFGTDERFGNCQECHGSQVTIGFERESGRFETRVKSLSINCESCHGPARAHVDLANSGGLGGSEELGVRPLGLLSEDESLEVCFQCHALKGVIEPGYLPGTPLQDYYSLLMPLLGDRPLLPDGRVREFAYQQNHIASDCYLNGTMNCLDCHDPHSSSYRDIYSRPLIGRFDDRQCTDCHASKAVAPQLHTKHAVDSRGSQCVTCHMPFLQHPEVGSELRFARSDHSIPIPRPAFDSGLGLMNACAECHRNISTDSLQRATDSWWGELKPHKPVVQGAFRAFNGEAAISPGELLHPDTDHVMAQMSALTSVFERYLSPNMSVQDSALVEGLKSLTFHDNVDIRSVALAALHLAFGDDPKLRRFLVERLRSLSSEDYAVRSRWVLTLGFYADTYRESGRPGDAITVYNKALELLPDHSGIFRNMGLAYHAALDFQAAVAQFRRSLEIDPSHALTWVNMGVSLDRMELEREAEVAYRRALEVNPMEPLAYFNLGNVLLRRGDVLQAVAQYEQAVLLSPSLAYGHYYMARGLIQMEEYERALDAARLAVEFDPNISGAQEMLADLERFFGG